MVMKRVLLFCCILFLFYFPLVFSETTNCAELGFKETILCSSCKELESYIPDEELVNDCKRCCAAETENKVTTFSSGRLIVCRWKIGRYPHVQEFLNREITHFPQMSAQFIDGADPILEMRDLNDVASRIPIDGWKTEDIVEFLQTNLKAKEQ